jgi:hypothetical protein
MPFVCFCAKRKPRVNDPNEGDAIKASDDFLVEEVRQEAKETHELSLGCSVQDNLGTPVSHAKISEIQNAVMTPDTEAVVSLVASSFDDSTFDVKFAHYENETTRIAALAESSRTPRTAVIQNIDLTAAHETEEPSSEIKSTSLRSSLDGEYKAVELSTQRFETVCAEITIPGGNVAEGSESPHTKEGIRCNDVIANTGRSLEEEVIESLESTSHPLVEDNVTEGGQMSSPNMEPIPQEVNDRGPTVGEKLYYIDEFGMKPEDQYNSATNVSFFNQCSATLGYPAARLLQYRLSGIMSLPESRGS